MVKNYYCKIKDKTFGPMTLEQLKNLAIQGKLQPTDKVSLTFPIKDGLIAGSIFALNEIYKTQADNSNSESFVFEETQADNNYVANYFKTDGIAINEGNPSGFSQGVNLDLLEQNSIEIYKLLKNINVLLEAIKGWVTFMGIVLVIYIICSIILAVLMNPAITPRR